MIGAGFQSLTSVLVGAPNEAYTEQIKNIMRQRLTQASQSKISTAVSKWWLPFRLQHNLPSFIPPGSSSRGGEMAAFTISIVAEGRKYGTMQGYIWGIQEFHKHHLGSHADPLDGVADWSTFMHALMVQTWVDTKVESHRMVPFKIFLDTMLALNQSSRADVALGLMMLIMLFTMCRSQTPLPKAKNGFDPSMHFRRKDVKTMLVNGVTIVVVAMGIVKNSTRKERANRTLCEKRDKPIGRATGVLDVLHWYYLYVSMSSWDNDNMPFFYDEIGSVLTYVYMLDYLRLCMMRRYAWQIVKLFGFHGLRVLGFNLTRAGNGEEVAVLIGEWRSTTGWQPYSRENLLKVMAAAQRGVVYAAGNALAAMPLDSLPVPDSAQRPQPDPSRFTAFQETPSPPPEPPFPPPADPSPPSVSPPPPHPRCSVPIDTTGYPPDVVVVDSIKAGGSRYRKWKWRGRVYYTLRALRAAYQDWQRQQELQAPEFFTSLQQYGYKLLDWEPHLPESTSD